MSKRDTARWRVCRDFQGREWLDGAVVYDTASGDTHQLALMAFQILTCIRDAPCTQEEILHCVLSSPSTKLDEENPEAINSVVQDLHTLGLIELESH